MALANNLGLTASALSLYLSGTIASISLVTTPVLGQSSISDQQKLQLWQAIFESGKAQAPVIAGTALALHLTSSYLQVRPINLWRIAAAVLTVSIVPFTIIFMDTTNQKMIRGAQQGTVGMDVAVLLARWTTLNLARSVLPLVAGVIGLWCCRDAN